MARGKSVQSLQDLSREPPKQEEIDKLQDSLAEESDRGMALISSALAELGLFWAIYRRMPYLGEEVKAQTFIGVGAPLGSFSSRIIIARAMGIIGPETETLLNQVRQIRNAFAHALRSLDFENDRIKLECERLKLPSMHMKLLKPKTAREQFRVACSYLYSELFMDAMRQEGMTHAVHLP